jgi:hypothetical protein
VNFSVLIKKNEKRLILNHDFELEVTSYLLSHQNYMTILKSDIIYDEFFTIIIFILK